MPSENLLTRRFFYWIPKAGEPVKILHGIEEKVLDHLPGKKNIYRTWQELEQTLQNTLAGTKKIAMEYSPRNALPYLSKVDGGTLELIRSFGLEVKSSANLLQQFTSVWNEKKLRLHLEAADVLDKTAHEAWEFIRHHLKNNKPISEFEVQSFILEKFAQNNCISQDPPLCAVNAHSANPHYTPTRETSLPINPGDFVLIDLWCKKNTSEAVYADITRVAVAAPEPTPRQKQIFEIVRRAQKAATDLVIDRFAKGEPIRGWEVDRTCRQVIQKAGFGDYFIHRTGHNIDINDHGNGAHIDDYETHDERLLIPCTCFSIEPGIYLPNEFGVRLEYDLYIHKDGEVQITGGQQNSIHCLA
jgi:Xaa-Pro aminopeptidase